MILLFRGEQRISRAFSSLRGQVVSHRDVGGALNAGTIELFLGMGLRTFGGVVRAIVVGRPVALGSEKELHFAATAMD
jgi:hypothetical protein